MDPAFVALASVDFEWTTHVESVWRDLPHDVPELQRSVREEVVTALGRLFAASTPASPLGIPIVGAGGAGKTHFLSTLRRTAFERRAFFILVDMTDVHDFWETVLLSFIRSLRQNDASGQSQQETLLAHLVGLSGVPTVNVERLKMSHPPGLINQCNGVITGLRRVHPDLRDHQDVVRALVLLVSNDFDLQDLGYKWLQGVGIEDDEKLHHGFHDSRRAPIEIVRGLSYVTSLCGPSILALDQLDAIVAEQHLTSLAETEAREGDSGAPPAPSASALGIIQGIARGLSALRDVTRRTQTVLSCLEQTWSVLDTRPLVTMRDRFLKAFLLKPSSNRAVAQRIVELRLAPSYAAAGFQPPYPTYPFLPPFFQRLAGASPREVLKACDEHRANCQRLGKVVETGGDVEIGGDAGPGPAALARKEYEELRAKANVDALVAAENEEALDTLLEAACLALVRENPVPANVDTHVDLDFMGASNYEPLHARVRLVYRAEGDREKHFAVRFLQKGHHLAFQARLKAAMTASGIDTTLPFRQLVIFRQGAVPGGPATARLVDELKKRGGRFVEPSREELRTLWALARMVRDKRETVGVTDWLKADRVVSRLPSFAPVVEYLFSDAKQRSSGNTVPPARPAATGAPVNTEPRAPATPPASTPTTGAPVNAEPQAPATPPASAPTGLFIGRKLVAQVAKDAILIPFENLVKHTVVLAGAGSGKTVLIRRIIEEAALLGVPSIVIDGANDLSRLGDPWPESPASFDAADVAKASRYASTAEVVVWTPGRSDGNPLVLDPLPRFADVKDNPDELEAAIYMARASLEPIVALSKGAAGKVKTGLLASAIRHFALSGGGSLHDLVDLLAELPPEAHSGFDKAEKHGRELADALRSEMETNPLLRGTGASLDPAVLLGARTPGKTRVSVVNLSGLPGLPAQQHLVNQLAMTLFTWIKKNPPKGRALQGLLVVDEARDFVPSGASVPGKDSLIRLAAQARKYGLGLVFATQAPKSIDHNVIANCSTQFFGRANSPAAIETVQQQLQLRGGTGSDVAKLPKGCFYVYTEGLQAAVKVQVPLCLSHHPASPPDESEIHAKAVRSRAIA